MATKEQIEEFRKRFPLIAKLADKIEEKGMKIVYDEDYAKTNNTNHEEKETIK